MIPRSVRWRLPLSYAAIALLAALSLGIVLLTTLRGYYTQRERDYLSSNARAIGAVIAPLVEEVPLEVLHSHLDSFSFLSQSRLRLLDTAERPIIESDFLETFKVSLAAVPIREPVPAEFDHRFSLPSDRGVPYLIIRDPIPVEPDGTEAGYRAHIVIRREFTGDVIITGTESLSSPMPFEGEVWVEGSGDKPDVTAFRTMSFVGTPYGFGLSADVSSSALRSSQVVREPLRDTTGDLLGYVELSDGPAYGREIVNSVARGWALAGGAAVLLAAGVGWLVSRRISAPLLALTDVTAQMAEGDLSARADIARQDEFGTLGHSFNRMANQVEETILTLRRFVSDAAHEIRTPLTALRTNLELAPDDDFVKRAQAQVERLEALTQNLLDLSRIEAGEQAEAHAQVALIPLVQEMSELYASRAEQAGLTFGLVLPEMPVTVQGDETQLRCALGNLLDNAIKFTPEGGAVSVGLHQEGERAELWVKDTGIGIPDEDLPHILSRFHRGRNTAAYPGSGLGLAIVKAIAENHNGTVAAENIAQGSLFKLRLPTVN
jgi:signal transduction histidine kinase